MGSGVLHGNEGIRAKLTSYALVCQYMLDVVTSSMTPSCTQFFFFFKAGVLSFPLIMFLYEVYMEVHPHRFQDVT